MIEKLKSMPLLNLIIIGLLCYILFSKMFITPPDVRKIDTSIYENQITQMADELKSLKKLNIESDKKIDAMNIILAKTSTNINYIQTQLKDEKTKINTMSDDENVKYFYDYINQYNSKKSND